MSVNYPAINKRSDQEAVDVPVDTSTFGGVLSASDVDVQTALETIDDVKIGSIDFTATYDESISATYLVTSSGANNVVKSEPDTYENASVIGIATNTGSTSFVGTIRSFGIFEDASFTFGTNVPLYLGTGGVITSTAPTSGILTRIGKSLGAGKILINIDEPITL